MKIKKNVGITLAFFVLFFCVCLFGYLSKIAYAEQGVSVISLSPELPMIDIEDLERIYEITYYDIDGNKIETLTQHKVEGDKYSMPAVPSLEGYSGVWSGVLYDKMPSNDLQYYASYTLINFSIKIYRANGTCENLSFNINNKDTVINSIGLSIDDEYDYYWSTSLPQSLELKDYVLYEMRNKKENPIENPSEKPTEPTDDNNFENNEKNGLNGCFSTINCETAIFIFFAFLIFIIKYLIKKYKKHHVDLR